MSTGIGRKGARTLIRQRLIDYRPMKVAVAARTSVVGGIIIPVEHESLYFSLLPGISPQNAGEMVCAAF
jgi:hypothetical protein